MTLVVQSATARVPAAGAAQRLERVLSERGQVGLLRQAADRYRSAFAEAGLSDVSGDGGREPVRPRYRASAQFELLAGRPPGRSPVLTGDLYPTDGHGFVYLLAHGTERVPLRAAERGNENPTVTLEVGYIGSSPEGVTQLDGLLSIVDGAFDDPLEWDRAEHLGARFIDLTSAEGASYAGGASVTGEDVRIAAVLERADVRQAAVTVRRAGNLLASDLAKRCSDDGAAVQLAGCLVEAGLLTREYVVVCGQSSRQVNRLRTLEALASMADAGVLCSCGRPIEQEQVEELLVPTPDLQRMLDQSYWTTARLVGVLRHVGVADGQVVLNRQEGPDEIDAFVDVHGSLLMFELKDDEFSMGHAYRFGGRVAQYRPDYAFIVSTKGISPDVKAYFGRVKPETRQVYVDTLAGLEGALQRTVTEIRARVAARVLDQLDGLATVRAPVSRMIGARLNVQLPAADGRWTGLTSGWPSLS